MKAPPIALLISAMLLAAGFPGPEALDFDAGVAGSRIALPGMAGAWQIGPRVSFSQDFYPFGSSGALVPTLGVSGRYHGFGASRPAEDGSLYRAWQALGLGAFLGARYSRDSLSFSFDLGAYANVSKFSGTGLLGAHPSLAASLGAKLALSDRLGFGISLPFEYAWKGGAGIATAGFSIAGEIRLGRKQ